MNTPQEAALLASIREALGGVLDPEFGINVIDLGLIYDLSLENGHVAATMTLTSMFCPAGQVMLDGVRCAIEAVPGVASAEVGLVWEPAWTPDRLSPAAREHLGWRTE